MSSITEVLWVCTYHRTYLPYILCVHYIACVHMYVCHVEGVYEGVRRCTKVYEGTCTCVRTPRLTKNYKFSSNFTTNYYYHSYCTTCVQLSTCTYIHGYPHVSTLYICYAYSCIIDISNLSVFT